MCLCLDFYLPLSDLYHKPNERLGELWIDGAVAYYQLALPATVGENVVRDFAPFVLQCGEKFAHLHSEVNLHYRTKYFRRLYRASHVLDYLNWDY